jgi:hypothetical protein
MSLLNWPSFVDPETATAAEETSSEATLLPERALLTPAWVASLAVLGLNDHLLKGAELLPGAVTGKLSDVAGMIVAPALLAALTRTKSRRGLFLCHLAVGAVFAAINLSVEAASMWSALMGAVAMPWQITVDPTDLLALPALYLSWRALTPAMSKPVPRSTVRALEGSLACAGVCLSVATSPPPDEWNEGEWWTNPVNADVYIQNISEESVVVRLRGLKPDVRYDCFELANDPSVLSEELFGEAVSWTLNEGNVINARDMSQNEACYAVLVEGDTFPQTLLFWERGDVPVEWIDGTTAMEGGVILEWDGDRHTIEARQRPELIQELGDPEAPPAGACAVQEDGDRLAWTSFRGGDHRIAAIDVGPDGCLAVDVALNDPDGLTDWYVCMPPELFPFAPGDWIRGEDLGDTLVLRRVVGSDQEPLSELAELYLSAGDSLPPLIGTELALNADFSCALAPDACGTVARQASVTAKRGALPIADIAVGQTVDLSDADETVKIHVAHAQERVVLNPACSEGPVERGGDVEMVAVITSTL